MPPPMRNTVLPEWFKRNARPPRGAKLASVDHKGCWAEVRTPDVRKFVGVPGTGPGLISHRAPKFAVNHGVMRQVSSAKAETSCRIANVCCCGVVAFQRLPSCERVSRLLAMILKLSEKSWRIGSKC